MKAITVEPHKPETARLEEIADPDVRDGSVLVEAIAVGVCGTDVEIVEGKYGWAPRGQDAPRARARIPRPRAGPGPERRAAEGRPRRRHRPAPGSRALSQLRRRRVGHVPERPVHRARHQGDRRLHVRALADRARVRHEGGPFTRPAWRAARAHDGRHEGVGAGQRRRPARLLGAADRARDRRRTDWSSCRPRREAARTRGPRPRPRRIRAQAGAGAGSWGDLSHRQRWRTSASSRTSSSNARASGRSSRTRCRPSAPAASSVSRASGAAAGRPGSPRPTSRRRWCCGTMSSSAA